jgi:hypothetical protein
MVMLALNLNTNNNERQITFHVDIDSFFAKAPDGELSAPALMSTKIRNPFGNANFTGL